MEVSIGTEEVKIEFIPLFRMYRSGRDECFGGTDRVLPSLDPATGVDSKDVIIDPSTSVYASLYLPPTATGGAKLPILVYIHGRGFSTESAASAIYHRHLNDLSSLTPLIAVSVDYRLAPEHRLPSAYDDSWTAFRWVFSRADPWLAQHGDFGRIFVAGDSAGGNIAHDIALRAATEGLGIKALVLIHPYFVKSVPVGSEFADSGQLWRFIFPNTEGLDEPRRNPLADGAPSRASVGCQRVLMSGWRGEVEMLQLPEENHDFHFLHSETEQAENNIKILTYFFREDWF